VVHAGVSPSVAHEPRSPSSGDLWVVKHKPQHSKELVGNATLIATLRQWLVNWCAFCALCQRAVWPCSLAARLAARAENFVHHAH